ncbi:unnamed protein product, partial [Musa hybrid cultivar]
MERWLSDHSRRQQLITSEEWKNPLRGGASVISTADRRGAVLLRTHPPRDLRSQST